MRPNKHEFEFTSVTGSGLYAIETQYGVEPVHDPCPILFRLQMLQGRKLEPSGLAHVEVLPATGFCGGIHGHALVEDEDAGFFVTAHLHGEKGESRGLAGARGAKHDRMADVPDVEVQAEGTGPCSHTMAKRRRVRRVQRAGCFAGAGPDRA